MKQDATTYYVWIGGSCDYGHEERAGAAAVIVERGGELIKRDNIADLHTTEFRMMLTLMVKTMQELPERSEILFLTNAAYILNFDKTPTAKTANADLISQCIEEKERHQSAGVKIVSYHKSPFLIETHEQSTLAMKELRNEYHNKQKQQTTKPSIERVARMELLHDVIREAVDSKDINALEEMQNDILELRSYYEGPEWMADFDADSHGSFPQNLKRGILAEDTLCDLFDELSQLLK